MPKRALRAMEASVPKPTEDANRRAIDDLARHTKDITDGGNSEKARQRWAEVAREKDRKEREKR